MIRDPLFAAPWSLQNGGTIVFTLPRATVVRSFCMNHPIDHRGRLPLYLRRLDVPPPQICGLVGNSL